MSGFFKDNPPATQVGSEDATESTIQEDAVTQTDTSGGFYQGSPDQTTTDAYTADALASKNAAEAAKVAAEAAQAASETAKTAAETAETNAETAETNAETAETNAETAETNAAASESAAATSATSAAGSAATATTKASEAAASASNAATSATSADTAKTAAETAETNSETAETNAASSASSASTSASNASTSATAASGSASAASTSETNAASSATAAATSATNAATSETNAASSATSASNSATTATTQASTSTTQAGNSATSATAASNSASSAASAQTAAEAARDSALAALDSFDDRYLGSKSSAPTLDNDGNALVSGALYFDSTSNAMKVYDGSQWLNAYASLSGALIANQNLSDLDNVATARTNLGLGTAATTAASDYATAAQADQTVTLSGGTGITTSGTYPNFTVTNSSPDQTVSLTGSGATTVSGTYPNFTISSTDTNTDTNTTYTAGSGLTLTGTTFSNSAPDQTVSLTGSGATTVSGTYPNFTITSTDTNTDTNTEYTAGSGITLTGTVFSNSAPDQTVALTGSGGTTVSGTYPNFTISSAASIDGTTINPSAVQIGGTTVIDSSRDLAVATASIGGATNSLALNVYHPTTNVVARFESGDGNVWIDLHDSNSGTYGALLGHDSTNLFKVGDSSAAIKMSLSNAGTLTADRFYSGVGTAASPAFQVGDTNTGLFDSGSNRIAVACNGAAEFDFGASRLDMMQNRLDNVSEIQIVDANTKLSEGDGNSVRITTNSGYVDIGPQNTTWCHFQTDRGKVYFQQSVHFDEQIYNYVGGTTSDPYWRAGNDGSGSGLDADLLDGQQGSYYNQRNYTDNNNYLGGHYVSGGPEKPNSSALGGGKLKLLMLSGSNVGVSGSWNDVLWMSSYTGGDVKKSTAFISSKYDNTSVWLNKVNRDSSSWGTNYLFWNSGNDGAGSGLDADSVDGIHANGFLRSDATDYITGTLLVRADIRNETAYRDHGMYGDYDSYKTNHIWSMGSAYRNSSSGANFGNLYGAAYTYSNRVYTSNAMAGGHQMVWCSNGTPKSAMGTGLWTSGNVTAYSDIRVKTNLEIIPNALEKVQKLNGYTFDRTDVTLDQEGNPTIPIRQTGVVAQEVLEVLPEAVTGDEDSHYNVAYGNMVGLLIEAIKELQSEVDDLKQQLEKKK